jgi:hypothetical protein
MHTFAQIEREREKGSRLKVAAPHIRINLLKISNAPLGTYVAAEKKRRLRNLEHRENSPLTSEEAGGDRAAAVPIVLRMFPIDSCLFPSLQIQTFVC